MRLKATVLGDIALRVGEHSVDLGGPRQRRLLAALLVHSGDVVPTYRLIDAVWVGAPPPGAERTFRTYVARLRRAIDQAGVNGAEVVLTAPSGYSISPLVEFDAVSFSEAVDQARQRLALGDTAAARGHVDEALRYWSGPAFAEFTDEDWVVGHARRLEELRIVAQELAVEVALESGAIDAAIADGRRLAELHSLRERPHRLLMLALYRSGRQVDAVRLGQDYRERLREEAGLDPTSDVDELERRILQQDPALDRMPTRSVHGYRLGEVIASATDAVMHRAVGARGDRLILVAVSERVANDSGFIHAFEFQARARAAIRSPGLVAWQDFWREPGAAYVVTTLPSGGSFRAWMETPEPLTSKVLARLVHNIGDALSALHRSDIFHGGLTFDDVFIEEDREEDRFVLVGPVPGLVRGQKQEDDVTGFAALVLDVIAGKGHATRDISPDNSERLQRTLCAARDGRFGSDLNRLIEEILRLLGLGHDFRVVAGEPANPYRGLEAFDERHAALFFGREVAVGELDRSVRCSPFVAVIGPSGSGKSSVVRAGLIPRVRSDNWLVTVMHPGLRSLDELRQALAAVSTNKIEAGDDPDRLASEIGDVVGPGEHLLLVIDQFEEFWTIADPGQRNTLLTSICHLADGDTPRVHVVVTLRADYLGHALGHPLIGGLIRDNTMLLAPMTSAELAEAIIEPARRVGVTVETELAAAIVAEAGQNEGSLPMVQFALTELFEQRTDGVMTLDVHRRLGGLTGVITRCAEEVYGRLSSTERHAARSVLTRLVALDSFGDPTRRRLSSGEIDEPGSRLVTTFADARLLTFDRDRSTRKQVVEIVHESLAREWPRLRGWIEADRESLLVLRRLSVAATAWDTGGRDPADLYRGSRLEVAEQLANSRPSQLTSAEADFLRESRADTDADHLADQRRSRRLRKLAVGLALALVAVVVMGVVAEIQRRAAVARADEVTQKTIEASARQLSADAIEAIDIDPDLAILLAAESVRRSEAAGLAPVDGAVEALHTVVQSSRILARFPGTSLSAMTSGGERAALVEHDELVVIDLSTQEQLARRAIGIDVVALDFSPDGEHIVAATTSRIVVLRTDDLSTLAERVVDCCVESLDMEQDGRWVAAQLTSSTGQVQVWSMPDLLDVRTIDGAKLAGWIDDEVVAFGGFGVRRFGTTGGQQLLDVPVDNPRSVDVHPDGDRLLVADSEQIVLWSTTSTNELQPVVVDGWGVLFQRVNFDASGRAIVAYGPSDEIRWQSLDGSGSHSLRGHPTVVSVSGDGDGQQLIASGRDETLLWDLSDEGPAELGALAVNGEVWAIEFSEDGGVMYVAEQVGDVSRARAIDLATRATISEAEFGTLAAFAYPTFTSSGWAAGWAPDGESRVEDLATGRLVARLAPCQVPAAIDAVGRWLYVHDGAGLIDGCGEAPGRVIDPATGEVLFELPERTGLADIGPPGTISDGLLAYQVLDPDAYAAIALRDLRSGELIAQTTVTESWRPFFSSDGRYLTFGSWIDGGFAIDIGQVLAGTEIDEAIVINPRLGAATSFSVAVGDQLVTGHAGEVLRFWDLDDGRPTVQLPADSGDTTFIAPSVDGRFLHYEDEGNVLRRFPLDLDELLSLAERRVQRDFRQSECDRYQLGELCPSPATS